jgi:hypothetical protein
MIAFEKCSRTEQVLLLGFLPLLGATTHLTTALAGIVIVVVAHNLVRALASRLPAKDDDAIAWILFAAVGFATAIAITHLARYWVAIPDRAIPYLYLSGFTPLVFAGIAKGNHRADWRTLIRFGMLMLGFGIAREALGSGTLLGNILWSHAAIPIGILSLESGALLLFATAAIIDAIARTQQTTEAN